MLTLNICERITFQYSYKRVIQFELLTQNSTKDVFLDTFFQIFQNGSFCEQPLKNV